MTYKYSKLAKKLLPNYSWESLIDLQAGNRVTGRTEGLMLLLISKALLNPDKSFDVLQETELSNMYQYDACGGVCERLDQMISELGLEFLEHNCRSHSLTYKPFGYVKKGWEVVE